MMQALRQLGGGVIIAIVSVILVLGGISLALAETLPTPAAPTEVPPTLPLSFPTPTGLVTETATLASETPTTTTTATETTTAPSTATVAFVPTVCTPSTTGWVAIITTASDTIYSLAQRYNTTPEILSEKNCLASINLSAGTLLYVPPVPATARVTPCGPPAGWVNTHIVKAGENLYRIALSYGITYQQLQSANCMGSSVLIYVGQRLWVPNVPTLTSIPGTTTVPNFPTGTPTVTASFTTMPPTATTAPPSATFMPTATIPTATFTPSLTPFPTNTQ
jgi:LysM repeat protein